MNDDDEGGDEGSGDVVKVVMKVILSSLGVLFCIDRQTNDKHLRM